MKKGQRAALSEKQRLFVAFYVVNENGQQSARSAGYSHTGASATATRLLKYPVVIKELERQRVAIARRREVRQRGTEVTREWLIEEFIENHTLARQGNPVLDRYGNPTAGTIRQLSASNKALEAIAVLAGHWVEKRKVGVDSDLTALMERIDGRSRGLKAVAGLPVTATLLDAPKDFTYQAVDGGTVATTPSDGKLAAQEVDEAVASLVVNDPERSVQEKADFIYSRSKRDDDAMASERFLEEMEALPEPTLTEDATPSATHETAFNSKTGKINELDEDND